MRVSAIIPTFNRSASLRRTLESLAVVRGDELEILVVDNGSTDDTRAAFDETAARHPARAWRYLAEPMPGLLSGRHAGAHAARGEICAFLDDDVRVAPTWLEAIQEAFRNPGVTLAGGPSTPRYETPPPEWLAGFWERDEHGEFCTWLSLFQGGDRGKPVPARYIWGLNYVIRREALFALGGFHPDCLPKSLQRFQGDGETGLSDRVERAGFATLYHPGMAVTHEVSAARLTPDYFASRAFYQGVCDSYTELRHTPGIATRLRRSLGALRRRLGPGPRPAASELEKIRELAARAHRAGYVFHQDAVRADPLLLAWVRRADYLDYQLPVGWERFAAGGAG